MYTYLGESVPPHQLPDVLVMLCGMTSRLGASNSGSLSDYLFDFSMLSFLTCLPSYLAFSFWKVIFPRHLSIVILELDINQTVAARHVSRDMSLSL